MLVNTSSDAAFHLRRGDEIPERFGVEAPPNSLEAQCARYTVTIRPVRRSLLAIIGAWLR